MFRPLPFHRARRSPSIDAGAALAATLAPGWLIPAPPAPGIAPLALAAGLVQAAALAAALGAGLLAWQLARLTILPLVQRLPAALGVTLTALLLLPGLGLAALAAPVLLALAVLRKSAAHRVVVLMVQCGAAAALAAAAVNHIGLLVSSVFLLLFPLLKLLYTPSGAANDNPSLERFGEGFIGCRNMQPMVQGGGLPIPG